MNFIFIAPNFPENYRHFCDRLHETVLHGVVLELEDDVRRAVEEHHGVLVLVDAVGIRVPPDVYAAGRADAIAALHLVDGEHHLLRCIGAGDDAVVYRRRNRRILPL